MAHHLIIKYINHCIISLDPPLYDHLELFFHLKNLLKADGRGRGLGDFLDPPLITATIMPNRDYVSKNKLTHAIIRPMQQEVIGARLSLDKITRNIYAIPDLCSAGQGFPHLNKLAKPKVGKTK